MFPILRRNWPAAARRNDIDRLFDSFLSGFPSWSDDVDLVPPLEVVEKDNELQVRVELPGVEEKELEIRLEKDILTIKGEKQHEEREEKDNYHLVETRYGSFARSIHLPVSVDPDKVDANFKNGVLTVSLPKAEVATSRRIEIKS